jgi:hypothetical protein
MFNHKIYDGLTSNDFKKGQLIVFAHRLGAIKQLTAEEDDGRAYFIGSSDDDI